MEIQLEFFEENPEGYIQRAGEGHTAFDWLVSTFGLDATVKIFTDMVRDRAAKDDTNYPYLDMRGDWACSQDIDSIAQWAFTPQGRTFWSILANELDDDNELTPDEIELVANAIYSNKPLTPEDL